MAFDFADDFINLKSQTNYPLKMEFAKNPLHSHFYDVSIEWVAEDSNFQGHKALLLSRMNYEVYETKFQHSYLLIPTEQDDFTFRKRIDVFFSGDTKRLFSLKRIRKQKPIDHDKIIEKFDYYTNINPDALPGEYVQVSSKDIYENIDYKNDQSP